MWINADRIFHIVKAELKNKNVLIDVREKMYNFVIEIVL